MGMKYVNRAWNLVLLRAKWGDDRENKVIEQDLVICQGKTVKVCVIECRSGIEGIQLN